MSVNPIFLYIIYFLFVLVVCIQSVWTFFSFSYINLVQLTKTLSSNFMKDCLWPTRTSNSTSWPTTWASLMLSLTTKMSQPAFLTYQDRFTPLSPESLILPTMLWRSAETSPQVENAVLGANANLRTWVNHMWDLPDSNLATLLVGTTNSRAIAIFVVFRVIRRLIVARKSSKHQPKH